MAETSSTKRRPIRAALDVLASTRTAVVLLVLIAVAAVVFLHLRLVPRWPGFLMGRGAGLAWVAVAGFWCVLFTYFGVNYLMSGLHSYA